MKLMIFDVESVGLWGEGFSVGWVLFDTQDPLGLMDILKRGIQTHLGLAACAPENATGNKKDLQWVYDNVKPLPEPNSDTPKEIREKFWLSWMAHGKPYLMADVPFPVEYNFLRACWLDDKTRDMPYPLLDAASVRFAGHRNPLGDYVSAHDAIQDCLLTYESIKEVV